MCGCVRVQNGYPEIRSFVDQSAVFKPEGEVVVDVVVGAAPVNECRLCLSVGPRNRASTIICRVEGKGSRPGQAEGSEPEEPIGSGY